MRSAAPSRTSRSTGGGRCRRGSSRSCLAWARRARSASCAARLRLPSRSCRPQLLPLVAPAGREAAEEAWHAAAEADTALRWQAARLAAVEPHRGPDPDLARALDDGVACQERLVVAVADLVAASADPLAAGRLQEVADRLHGLAQGLREVR